MINYKLDLSDLITSTKKEIEVMKKQEKINTLRKLANELQAILSEFEVLPIDNKIYTLMIKNNNIIGIDKKE